VTEPVPLEWGLAAVLEKVRAFRVVEVVWVVRWLLDRAAIVFVRNAVTVNCIKEVYPVIKNSVLNVAIS